VSLTLDLHTPGRSWLHRLDPRVKLVGLGLGMTAAFLLPHPAHLALYTALLYALLRLAAVPPARIGWLWRQLRLLLLLILLLQPFFTPAGTAWLTVGPLRLTSGGLLNALQLALRVLSLALLTGCVLFTTKQRALVHGLVWLGIPYSWGLLLSLTLRFVPAIGKLFVAVREAQAARGWVARGNIVQRTRDYLPVLVAVIIGTLQMSDQLTLALAARGLAENAPRTVWRPLRMRLSDWLALAVLCGGFLSLTLWRAGCF